MKSYCLKCRKNTENINPKVSNTSNGRTMILSKCAIYGSKKTRFVENQEAKGSIFCFECNSVDGIKMNEVVNKFLLAGDKFMP